MRVGSGVVWAAGWARLRDGVSRGVGVRVGLSCYLVTKFSNLVAKVSQAGLGLGVFSVKVHPTRRTHYLHIHTCNFVLI